jgi:hypothetical protein
MVPFVAKQASAASASSEDSVERIVVSNLGLVANTRLRGPVGCLAQRVSISSAR